MNEQTFNKRFRQLVTLVNSHPYREELITLMNEQVAGDTDFNLECSQ